LESETNPETAENMDALPEGEMSMAQLLAQTAEPEVGRLVKGLVVKIEAEQVVVDIGFKSEGAIDRSEFLDIEGNLAVKVGDEVEATIERMRGPNGLVKLSKRNVDKGRLWEKLEKTFKAGEALKGKVARKVKGGLRVDIGQLEAFLPASQAALEKNPNLDPLMEQILEFKILSLERARNNVVLSRRSVLEAERGAKRLEMMDQIKVGDVLEGHVKNVTPYGAFLDLGGVDGLLHIADVAWIRVAKVEEHLKVGESLRVMVLQVDREKGKISLGLKQLTPDPWTTAQGRYALGQVIETKVIHFVDYGAFLATEDGLEGFCHISEISWSKKVKHPSHALKLGDKVQAEILDVDFDKRKISFSIKKTQKSPWEGVVERYPVGAAVTARITSLADFGAFLELEDGLEGLLHSSDITWDKSQKTPQKNLKIGQELSVRVLSVDPDKKRISLGLKQAEGDPWDKAEEKFPVNTRLTGTVTRIADFGVFLEVEKNVEGLLHRQEMAAPPPKKLEDIFKPGDSLEAQVIAIDAKKRRLSLSQKALHQKPAPPPGEFEAEAVEKKSNSFMKAWGKLVKKAKKSDDEEEY
jgi:small subunit ribosomal protein S1